MIVYKRGSTEQREPQRIITHSEEETAVDTGLNTLKQMEKMKSARTYDTQDVGSDLSEQIKAATKDSHTRAENTELMLSYQRGQINMSQYKVLLCSLYEIYKALEDEMDRNASHPGVAPIFFPQELARLEPLERDLEHVLGADWRKKVIVPAATHRYVQRIRELGQKKPLLLVAHAYTRYLGDLSGGQVLGKITQKSLGLGSDKGTAFFAFPGVSSPNRFKQLYRSRMNSIELTEKERTEMLQEATAAFEFNIQVFDDLQKMLSVTTASEDQRNNNVPAAAFSSSRMVQLTVGVCVTLATIGMGIYAR